VHLHADSMLDTDSDGDSMLDSDSDSDSMLDSDSDIGVLATCDISTPPGETLKLESYGIELQVPATQHIEVRILQAFVQLTPDGTTML
jgi:hypothetical protein